MSAPEQCFFPDTTQSWPPSCHLVPLLLTCPPDGILAPLPRTAYFFPSLQCLFLICLIFHSSSQKAWFLHCWASWTALVMSLWVCLRLFISSGNATSPGNSVFSLLQNKAYCNEFMTSGNFLMSLRSSSSKIESKERFLEKPILTGFTDFRSHWDVTITGMFHRAGTQIAVLKL